MHLHVERYCWDGQGPCCASLAQLNEDVNESGTYVLFHKRPEAPTPTKWLSEWDASSWWGFATGFCSLVPRAFTLNHPAKTDDADFVFCNDDNVVMRGLRTEEPGKRARTFSKFLMVPFITVALMSVVAMARPLALLSLLIMKHDPEKLRADGGVPCDSFS